MFNAFCTSGGTVQANATFRGGAHEHAGTLVNVSLSYAESSIVNWPKGFVWFSFDIN